MPYNTRIIQCDPVIDSSRIVAELGTGGFIWKGQRPFSSMIECGHGQLMDATENYLQAAFFKYDLSTDALSLAALIPTTIDGNGQVITPTINGALMVATSGNVYGAEAIWESSIGKVAKLTLPQG